MSNTVTLQKIASKDKDILPNDERLNSQERYKHFKLVWLISEYIK